MHGLFAATITLALVHTAAGGDSCTHPLFVAGTEVDSGGNSPRSMAVGDLDGVNGPDLAVANTWSGNVSVLLNQGGGTFAPAVQYDAGDVRWSVAIGDLDGVDGPDLAVATFYDSDAWVLLNQGDGTFAPQAIPARSTPAVTLQKQGFHVSNIADIVPDITRFRTQCPVMVRENLLRLPPPCVSLIGCQAPRFSVGGAC